jgi:hypothetical protein
VGRTGLRAGWSIVMFALLVAGMVLARHVVLDALGPALSVGPQDLQNTPSLFLIVQEGSLAILILAATFAMAKVEGRWIWNYGLASPHLVRNFATGAVGGMAIFSALIGVMTVGHYLEFDGNALVGVNAIGYGLLGRLLFSRWVFRGNLLSWLPPDHPGARYWLLAGGDRQFHLVRYRPPAKLGRRFSWHRGSHPRRDLPQPVFETDRFALAGHRDPHGVWMGGIVCLRNCKQR